MQKLFISCSLFIVSLVIALALNKYFKLTLTLPLLTLGLGILLAQNFLEGKHFLRILAINIGTLFSLISVCFSVLNVTLFPKSSKDVVQSRGDYGTSAIPWLTKKDADGLGYKYKPSINNYTSNKIVLTPNNREINVYDVIYNINKSGNRLTPNNIAIPIETNNAILFVGGSYTFGEGLNDYETLSYFLQESSGRSAINAGMHGYGAHQALRILEDEKLYRKRTKGNLVKAVIYRSSVGHINRTAGYSPWDDYGPCYEIALSGNIEYRGSFEECGKKSNGILSKLIKRLTSSSEPFTAKFFTRFTLYGKYSNRDFLSLDIERFLAVTKRMEEITTGRGASFYIILEDAGKYDELCGTKMPFSEKLSKLLKNQHKNVILTSNVYSKNICSNNKLTISEYDGHPSKTANKILSNFLINNDLIK